MIENIELLIAMAMKGGDRNRTDALRAFKAAKLNYLTARDAKPYDLAAEISILKKLVEQREESASIYLKNNRNDLATVELAQAAVLKEYLPKPATTEEIEAAINNCGMEMVKKNMGNIIKHVKQVLPTADGKTISQLVSSKLS